MLFALLVSTNNLRWFNAIVSNVARGNGIDPREREEEECGVRVGFRFCVGVLIGSSLLVPT